MKHALKVLFSVILVFSICVIPTFAGCFADEPYTYTITVLSGDQSDFDGTDKLVYSDLKYGDIIDLSNTISTASANLYTDRYYVKGIRLSGHDNSEISSPAVRVTKDAIYVVAYGILGDMVNYTIRFHDAAGNDLIAPMTGQGQIGDKPVVAYKYIEGYSPNAYNLTRTLTADASANEFVFVYTKVETPEPTVTVITNNGTAATPNGNNAGNANNGNGNEAGNGDQATGINDLENPVIQAEVIEGNTGTGAGTGSGTESGTGSGTGSGDGAGSEGGSTAGQTPLELIDLDDEDVALAESPDLDNTLNSEAKKLSVIVPIIIIILIILTIFIVRRIKKKKEQEKNEIELF